MIITIKNNMLCYSLHTIVPIGHSIQDGQF